jgi:DNA mismatch repair protein MutS2
VKPSALIDDASAHLLGLDWLTATLAPLSPDGERCFATLRPFESGEERAAAARAAAVFELATALERDRLESVRAALREVPDAAGAIARAAIGDILDDPNFLELRRFCATIERIDELLTGTGRPQIGNAAVAEIGETLAAGGTQVEFYLDDAFDARLAASRVALAREQAELDALRRSECERAARELRRDEIVSDQFIVMRDDLHGALPMGVRVVREAPTYVLCELDYGEAALAALERRDAAAAAAATAEEDVRARLTALVRDRTVALREASEALGELDVLAAAARFTQDHACVPAQLSTEAVLTCERARFLPLEAELTAAGRRFVPIDLALHDVAVLTGPNMGGKSAALQTAGLVALCAAFGLPVPAARARVALFDQIAWVGLGRESQIGGLLSSFAREVVDLREILARGSRRMLILADEFARTTTPHEGKALLIALLAAWESSERAACWRRIWPGLRRPPACAILRCAVCAERCISSPAPTLPRR